MSENEIFDILAFMADSAHKIQERFSKIKAAKEFVSTPEGIILLDAITMRLQVIGESVKRIQKINPGFLDKYPEVEWNKIARLRDLVSHHYEQVDHEIIFDICKNHVPILEQTLQKIMD